MKKALVCILLIVFLATSQSLGATEDLATPTDISDCVDMQMQPSICIYNPMNTTEVYPGTHIVLYAKVENAAGCEYHIEWRVSFDGNIWVNEVCFGDRFDYEMPHSILYVMAVLIIEG